MGFQCPDCVHEGQASVRQPVTPAGAPVTVTPPYVAYALIAINLAVFGYEFLTGIDQAANNWGMYPPAVASGEFYRLLTSAFLHGSLLHIGFNMFVLYSIGPQVERALGHVRFAVLYLLAALGGAVASYVFSPDNTVSVGASGAIFGLMGALVIAGPRLGYDVRQVLILIAINIAIGFAPGGGIDWRAHLGGLVTGAAVAAVFVYAPKSSQVLWQILGALAILGVLVIVTMWRTAALQAPLSSYPQAYPQMGISYTHVISGASEEETA